MNLKNFLNVLLRFWSYLSHLFIVLIPIILLINLGFIYVVRIEKTNIISQNQAIAKEHSSIIDFVIRTAISDTYNDLQVIKDSNEFSQYADNPTTTTLSDLQQLMYRIATNKGEFLSIKFIDLLGNEVVRVNNENGNITIVADEDLETKSGTYYFGEAIVLEDDQLYISYLDLEVENNVIVEPYQPVLRFAISAYNQENEKIGYIFLNYDADKFLSVFEEYVDHNETSLYLGIFSGHTLYRFDSNDSESGYQLTIFQDLDQNSELLNSDYVNLDTITIESDIMDIMIGSDDFLYIYSYLDKDAIISENLSPLTRTPLFIIINNILVISLFTYLGYALKTKQENKVMLDASTYLSDNNKDGVIITNHKREIIYINKSFESVFGYGIDEIRGINVDTLMRLDYFKKTSPMFKDKEMLWNKNKSDIYLYITRKEEFINNKNNSIKHYIQIYSNPVITLDKLFEKIPIASNGKYSHLICNMAELFIHMPIVQNMTSIILIHIGNVVTDIGNIQNINNPFRKCQLSEYLRSVLDERYIISIPLKNFVLLRFDIDDDNSNIGDYITDIREKIDEYKYRLSFANDTNFLISADVARSESDTYCSLLFNVFASMKYLINSRNLRASVYMPKMRDSVILDQQIRLELDGAFKKDEFYMNYQVVSDVDTGKTVGVEALLRWKNEALGNISPADFVPIVENSYHVNELSKMVINKVIHDFEPYSDSLPEGFRISVNLTSYDFQNEMIITDIVNSILASSMKPEQFCFEITESGYLEDTMKTKDIINYLHSMNITIAIDDFGTGFASLSSLKNVTADKVKVDRMFIKDYPMTDNGLMHKTIVHLIKNMGFDVVIEGIENSKQLDLAKETKCDEFQGFLVSKPQKISDFVKDYLSEIFIKEKTTK